MKFVCLIAENSGGFSGNKKLFLKQRYFENGTTKYQHECVASIFDHVIILYHSSPSEVTKYSNSFIKVDLVLFRSSEKYQISNIMWHENINNHLAGCRL